MYYNYTIKSIINNEQYIISNCDIALIVTYILYTYILYISDQTRKTNKYGYYEIHL